MVKGIGTDITAIDRIADMIRKYGDHFLRKVFTDTEIAFCGSSVDAATHFAGRWAAKEAFYKALPSHCQAVSSWKSIQITAHNDSGRPVIEVCDVGLRDSLERQGITSVHVSINHEHDYCIGFVVLE